MYTQPIRTYFKHRPCTEYCLFNATALSALLAERREVVQQEVGAFGLARAALSTDDDSLIALVPQHAVVGGVGNSKNMRRHVNKPPVLVQLDILGVVDGIELEGVHCYQNGANIRVDVAVAEASPQVVQQVLLVEVGQLAQVGVISVLGLV